MAANVIVTTQLTIMAAGLAFIAYNLEARRQPHGGFSASCQSLVVARSGKGERRSVYYPRALTIAMDAHSPSTGLCRNRCFIVASDHHHAVSSCRLKPGEPMASSRAAGSNSAAPPARYAAPGGFCPRRRSGVAAARRRAAATTRSSGSWVLYELPRHVAPHSLLPVRRCSCRGFRLPARSAACRDLRTLADTCRQRKPA